MMTTFAGESLDQMLPSMLTELLDHGGTVGSRLGEQTRELLHVHTEITRPWRKENLTIGRRASLPAQIAETMWLLAGRNDVEWLSHYLPRAKDFSDDGVVWRGGYGPRIRGWSFVLDDADTSVDQLDFVIKLLREQPDTRRAIVQIYDPVLDGQPGKDVPCNDWLHFIQRDGRLDLHVAVRSNDVLWGLSGINAFEWGALLEITAAMVGAEAGSLHFSTTSLHLYDRHFDRAAELSGSGWRSAVLDSPRFKLPHVAFHTRDLDEMVRQWFLLEGLIREQGDDRAFVTDEIARFPEPMLRSWLSALHHHWNGAMLPSALLGTRLAAALEASPRRKVKVIKEARLLSVDLVAVPPTPEQVVHVKGFVIDSAPTSLGETIRLRNQPILNPEPNLPPLWVDNPELGADSFVDYCDRLHRQKSKAYGDSWRRRGETLGILANVARKLDRLAGGSTPDENYPDTCIDLLIYLLKYEAWLANPAASDDPEVVAHRLQDYADRSHGFGTITDPVATLNELFDTLAGHAQQYPDASGKDGFARVLLVGSMARLAVALAKAAWTEHKVWTDGNAKRVWQGYGE